ncbi:hypothetical protein [Mesorhizobium sp.]|uniref:hypothetical protein n=1 Tax=Mesorhizobium sp. TaxID=1871066 RepID=UPI000FE5E4F8|nr:hypothetical protein [Mesorhizobium sp.]RWM07829.1 MAG: hypothetical protein EOR71_14825 [Mesorhizobium sp.]RWM40901.1 MAG: hypothetical protein EOR75_07770 [Mesorhizobium sp.]TIO77593.1 MAG: hypothetical protein E5X75_10120 [Mesorhizobium sp.]TIO84423.1 MAG: hypothetical protein E5X74_16150 [Mesorhizobium sp.]TJV51896.1 MAG: hypothetical protein E5Y01_12865 [Mesorhizobium sp.]
MALITYFETDRGIHRLLRQPGCVEPRDAKIAARKLAQSSQRHQDLFDGYLEDIQTAYEIAVPWWADTVKAQEQQGLGREEALRKAFMKRAAGAAAHGNVIWIVRNYWLDCCDANKGSGEIVYPETLLLQWLIDAKKKELVRLIACMPYWPIGKDENGVWC